MAWGMWLALAISFLVFYVLLRMLNRVLPLVLHGIAGMALFWALGALGVLHVPLDWITFLIGAFGGLFGVVIVIGLTLLGVPM